MGFTPENSSRKASHTQDLGIWLIFFSTSQLHHRKSTNPCLKEMVKQFDNSREAPLRKASGKGYQV